MKKVKSIMAFVMVATLLFGILAGCATENEGGSENQGNETNNTQQTPEDIGQASTIEGEEVDETRKTTSNSDERYDSITMAISQDPQDLNPWNVNNASKKYVVHYFYESLFDFDATHYYPVLAKGYEIVDDLHWDVEIYDYIKDSNGNHITADDVVFSYNLTKESGFFNKSNMFVSIEKLDDYKVRFTWNKPITGVCELEWVFGLVKVVSQKAFEEGSFATNPVGTGPYVVKSFTAGSGLTLVRNENYWQTEELTALGHGSNVETIEIKLITEYAQQVIALQNGDIDFSYSIPNENLVDFMDGGEYADEFDVWRAPYNGYYYIEGNMGGDSWWSNKDFRMGVFYALDNEAISQVASLPAAMAACTPYWNEFYEPWSKVETYINTYDPDLAKEYLEKSGYDGSDLVLLSRNDEIDKNMATMVQSLLGQVDVNVKIEVMEQSQLEGIVGSDEGGYDMFILSGGGSSLIGGMNRFLNNADYANGKAPGMLNDPVLFEKFAEVNTAEKYTLEHMTDFVDYVMENGYLYVALYQVTNLVYSDAIAEVILDHNNNIRLGDFVYYLD